MLCKESLCEVNQIRDNTVIGICPEAGKFKAVACFSLFRLARNRILDSIKASAIGVVFRICSIGNNENLHIFKQSATCPKRITLITVYLIKRLTNRNPSAFQFNMNQGQTIYQYRHIVAIIVLCAVLFTKHMAQATLSAACSGIHLVLVDDLQTVIMDIFLIHECDVLRRAIVPFQHLDKVLLYLAGLFHDMLVGVRNGIRKKLLPLCIREPIVVQ